jgi:hypothetical protein
MKMHERVEREYSFPEKHELPFRLQNLMHDCGDYSAMAVKRYRNGPPICGNCNKVVPWFFFKCVVCDKYFVQDFRHPKFCGFYPTCWEHTLELEWDYCSIHRADPNKYEWFAQIVEPVGLNPKEFSQSELENVFNF